MEIWHISDTHGYHERLQVPVVDMVIFSGDCSNPPWPDASEPEVRRFLEWFYELPIQYKIFVAGNHDAAVEKGLVSRSDFEEAGIIYLHNESVEIEGLKIWGSPFSPTFGNGWAYNMDRDKLPELWATIPDDTDIIISHGPPQGYRDMAKRFTRTFRGWIEDGEEACGCLALTERVHQIKPKLVCFGHIHNNDGFENAGVTEENGIIYSNGSILTDRRFTFGPTSNGNTFTL